MQIILVSQQAICDNHKKRHSACNYICLCRSSPAELGRVNWRLKKKKTKGQSHVLWFGVQEVLTANTQDSEKPGKCNVGWEQTGKSGECWSHRSFQPGSSLAWPDMTEDLGVCPEWSQEALYALTGQKQSVFRQVSGKDGAGVLETC